MSSPAQGPPPECYLKYFLHQSPPQGLLVDHPRSERFICQSIPDSPDTDFFATLFDDDAGIAILSAYTVTYKQAQGMGRFSRQTVSNSWRTNKGENDLFRCFGYCLVSSWFTATLNFDLSTVETILHKKNSFLDLCKFRQLAVSFKFQDSPDRAPTKCTVARELVPRDLTKVTWMLLTSTRLTRITCWPRSPTVMQYHSMVILIVGPGAALKTKFWVTSRRGAWVNSMGQQLWCICWRERQNFVYKLAPISLLKTKTQ